MPRYNAPGRTRRTGTLPAHRVVPGRRRLAKGNPLPWGFPLQT